MHEFHPPIVVLQERRAAFHPVAAVVIGQLREWLYGGRVDVAADTPSHWRLRVCMTINSSNLLT
jgi:hypothetical protein